jgi:hypothetical protein
MYGKRTATSAYLGTMKKTRKKLAGTTCVYCASAPAVTMDHVFARSFFAETQRDNLPQVPACEACNNTKAILEHYLATVLLFGGRHPDAAPMLEEMGERRLAKNIKLKQQLASSIQYVTVKNESGAEIETMALDFDGQRLESLFAFITRGLVWCHWGVLLGDRHAVSVLSLSAFGQESFGEPLLRQNAKQRASGNLGNGTFTYDGSQGVDYPEFSFWRFGVYGNTQISGNVADPNAQNLGLFAFTARKEAFETENYREMIMGRC